MRRPRKISSTKVTSWAMLGIGAGALLFSIIYVSSILAFAGLGLLFWGALLLYIKNPEYTQKDLLEASVHPSLETISQIIRELAYKGNAVYLPPRYFENPGETKIYISKQENANLPTPEQIQKHENQVLVRDSQFIPQGILLTPPGEDLARLFERKLEMEFTKADLEYLHRKMPQLFIEDLEIAQNFEMETANNKVHVKLANTAYTNLFKDIVKPSNDKHILGYPIASAIACALAKTTGKPIVIENQRTSNDYKDIEIEYRILEEEKTS
jgi:hypothetical protein